MLTKKEVTEIKADGWIFTSKKGTHPKGHCALCIPNAKEIRLYLPGIWGYEALELTLIHECIHIRDKKISDEEYHRSDWSVEAEAQRTHTRNPTLVDFIINTFSLNDVVNYFVVKCGEIKTS